MNIDYFIPLAKPDITEEEIKEASSIIKSGWLTTGPKVIEFENLFSSYFFPCANNTKFKHKKRLREKI